MKKKAEKSSTWQSFNLQYHIDHAPEVIRNVYILTNDFIRLPDANFQEPITRNIYDHLKFDWKTNKGLRVDFIQKFSYYSIGFLKGFDSDFNSSVISNDSILRETVVDEIFNLNRFSFNYDRLFSADGKKVVKTYYKNERLEAMGFAVGRNYKAWTIVLQAPSFFKDYFLLDDNKQPVDTGSQKKSELTRVILGINAITDEDWNSDCQHLFKYLEKNYNGAIGKQRYLNIFRFLKNADSPKERKEIKIHLSFKTFTQKFWGDPKIKSNKQNNWENQYEILNDLYKDWKNGINN